MFNIFLSVFFLTLMAAFIEPYFFIAFLIGLAIFGLFQAIFMANAGGSWDNAKKLVEVDLKEKGTPLHEATVVGDTVGDPFKDTTSVALNPASPFAALRSRIAHGGPWLRPDARTGGGFLPRVGVVRVPVLLRNADRIGRIHRCRGNRIGGQGGLIFDICITIDLDTAYALAGKAGISSPI